MRFSCRTRLLLLGQQQYSAVVLALNAAKSFSGGGFCLGGGRSPLQKRPADASAFVTVVVVRTSSSSSLKQHQHQQRQVQNQGRGIGTGCHFDWLVLGRRNRHHQQQQQQRQQKRHFWSHGADVVGQQRRRHEQNPPNHHNRRQQIRCMGSWPKMFPKRVRVITCDVTGTLVSFRGSLAEHYLGSARKCGIELSESTAFAKSFRQAYREVSLSHPCFGGNKLSAKEWWKLVVLRSFELAGVGMTPSQRENVFQRIYSVFGSQAAYEKFNDTLPFLHWCHRNNVVCGIISNADERYGDSILPMLGLSHDELQFQCYSKDYGMEKPDARFYNAAMRQAQLFLSSSSHNHRHGYGADDGDGLHDPLLPSQVLHIGNDYSKDFEGARRAGMHAFLLDRYDEDELSSEWKRRGALVFRDLLDVVEILGRSQCNLG